MNNWQDNDGKQVLAAKHLTIRVIIMMMVTKAMIENTAVLQHDDDDDGDEYDDDDGHDHDNNNNDGDGNDEDDGD